MQQRIARFLLVIGLLLIPLLTASAASAANSSPADTAYQFSFTSGDGKPLPLAQYRGKVLLVVNTASLCGFTGQYADLQKLYETYKDQGLVVLGVPSNDFGGQEPGTDAEIKAFSSQHYHVSFPLTQKTVVSGDAAHPFYKWAAAQGVGGIFSSRPRWNFHKYLIDRHGVLVDSFTSTTSPAADSVREAVEKALAETVP